MKITIKAILTDVTENAQTVNEYISAILVGHLTAAS